MTRTAISPRLAVRTLVILMSWAWSPAASARVCASLAILKVCVSHITLDPNVLLGGASPIFDDLGERGAQAPHILVGALR